ncbi:NAD(P)H-binding protein [Streptomyces sp. NPDC058700]|uniref:NmrA family NAD(P)-binding protein n=1 Tax=Streptomyces sp. NPDC058700 TaxID=3346607 RepID=UPI0036618B5B
MNNETILVTGATGKTGRRVVQQLQNKTMPVRAASRSSQVRFDWTDQATWAPALRDITGMYLVAPDLGSAQATENITALARQAAAAGVRRAVLVSFPHLDTPNLDINHVPAAEQALSAAGLEATVLWPRWFFQNFSEDFLLDAVRSGDVRLPAGEGKEAFIDAEDIAAVAVTALTQDGHAGQTYELSGPRLMSFADAVSDIAHATGNDIRYTPLSAETYAAEQRASGVPEEWVQTAIGMYADIRSGALNSLTGDVEKVLGRPPRDFTDYARTAAAQDAWTL